ncbi:MAG: cyclic nucleotide-binding domain-containing protein [Desulfatitalea sp.]|nr:cyclic nucleotide-binding domain-containing protein [Desulfatitalea sp.]
MVRPFLRGTVVRAGLLLGSALILTSVNSYHPQYLSLVALPFVLAWIAAPMVLKRKYTSILKNLISSKMLDLKGLEEKNPGKLFKKDIAGQSLVQAFLTSKNDDAIWYARLLKSLEVDDIDALILQTIESQDESTQVRLVGMLSDKLDFQTFKALKGMLHNSQPQLRRALVKAMKHIKSGELKLEMDLDVFRSLMTDADPVVRGYAVACLYPYDPVASEKKVTQWLASEDDGLRKSGVIAAGETGQENDFAQRLESLIRSNESDPIVGDILRALEKMKSKNLDVLAAALLDHPIADVRHAALSVLTVKDAVTLEKSISLLGDANDWVREQAKQKIKDGRYIDGQKLVASLSRPNHYLRENIFDLLETLQIKNLDLYRFTQEGLEQCYLCLSKAEALNGLEESKNRQLLFDHLMEKKDLALENIFRVLAIHEADDRMKTLRRGLFSQDSRVRGNAIELLGNSMDKRLFRKFQPLLEGFSLNRTLASGKKYFRIPTFERSVEDLLPALLNSGDWIEVVLAFSLLHAMADSARAELILRHADIITGLCASVVPPVQQAAENLWCALEEGETVMEGKVMDNALTITDKILLLRNIAIFSGLSVSELGAIATVTETTEFPENETVIREGEPGEEVFLIISGTVSVSKQGDGGNQIQLDTMTEGDYFGEMALFEEMARSATIRTTAPSRFLILHKLAFTELVREYPRIALQICTALSQRLRNLQSRLAQTS